MTSTRSKMALEIVVGATDRATATLARIRGTLDRMQAPLTKFRGLLRLTGVSGAMRRVSDLAVGMGRAFVGVARQLSLVGSVGVASLGALVAKVTGAGDRTLKLAQLIGLNAEKLQEWRYAAAASGVKSDQLDNALKKLAQRVAEARAGFGESRVALHALGIDLVDAQGNARGLADVFPEIADALARIQDPQARLALAKPLFEEEGVALVNMIRDGSAGLAAAAAEARAAGAVATVDQLEGFAAFQTELHKLGAQVSGVTTQFVSGLLPAVQEVAAAFSSWLGDNQGRFERWSEWLARNVPLAVEAVRLSFQDFIAWLDRALDVVVGKTMRVVDGFRDFASSVRQFADDPVTGAQGAATSFGRGAQRIINDIPVLGPIQRFLDPKAAEMKRQDDRSAGELKVSFSNLPRGARIERDAAARRSTSLSLGYAMPEVGLS